MAEILLECQQIALERGGRRLFAGLSLTVKSGDLLLIRGDNGSGKSSLIKMLSGILQPASGQMCYNGTQVKKNSIYHQQVIYIGHETALYPHLTVEDNISFWAKLHGYPQLADIAMHYFQLEPYRYIRCEELSAGWQKRVALTRLITIPRPCWFLDEPTVNLDQQGIVLVESLIRTRQEKGGLIIMASHIPSHDIDIKEININNLNKEAKVN